MMTVKEGDVNIGARVRLIGLDLRTVLTLRPGANPSADEQDEALEDGATQVNNVVHSFRLQSTTFDKKSFLTYLKVTHHF